MKKYYKINNNFLNKIIVMDNKNTNNQSDSILNQSEISKKTENSCSLEYKE